jgi:hypothetical protein
MFLFLNMKVNYNRLKHKNNKTKKGNFFLNILIETNNQKSQKYKFSKSNSIIADVFYKK